MHMNAEIRNISEYILKLQLHQQLLQPEPKYHMSHGLSWMVLHSTGDAHAINIALDKVPMFINWF